MEKKIQESKKRERTSLHSGVPSRFSYQPIPLKALLCFSRLKEMLFPLPLNTSTIESSESILAKSLS